MLDQWRCPRPLDCNPRFPGQLPRRTPSPLRPRLGQALEPGTGRELGLGRQARLGQPLVGRMEPLISPLPPPPPHKVLVALNSGQLHSRPFLSQGQLGPPRSCNPTSDEPPAPPCAPVRPARSKVISALHYLHTYTTFKKCGIKCWMSLFFMQAHSFFFVNRKIGNEQDIQFSIDK